MGERGLRMVRRWTRRQFLSRSSMAALSAFAVLVGVPKRVAHLPRSDPGGDIQCILTCSPLECNGCACGGDYFHCVGSLGCTANYYTCATGHSCSPYCLPCPPLVPA